ncbi:hypothetical protein [Paraburkholderia sp.]|uniref:hypothetical protein n=1 Tax=Paraburkholderia sp. TaxID=1926495 RepID=UPI003D6E95F1
MTIPVSSFSSRLIRRWYGFVALVLSHAGIATRYRRGKAWIDRACGAAIVALGVRQLVR